LLLASAAAIALTGLTASLSKVGLGLIFLTASTRFLLGGVHQLTGNEGWEDAAGIVGLFLFVLALYGALPPSSKTRRARPSCRSAGE
jgi:succinate-acetate transporter protein